MPLETKPFVVAEYLRSEHDLAGYLAVVLEETAYPTVFSDALADATVARGGLATLSAESGVAIAELQQAIAVRDASARPVLNKVLAAYQHRATGRKVA